MADEINSIIQEINEELRNDRHLNFLKKHKDSILFTIIAGVVVILAYSSWYNRQIQHKEEITNAILDDIQSPSKDSSAIIDELEKDAPAGIKTMLALIKIGKNLHNFKDLPKTIETLIDLTKKRGIDIVWKDLATIIFASHRFKSTEDLIQMLEPLTGEDRPFRFTALEFNAMNYISIKDYKKATENLEKIISSSEAPKTLKKRIVMLRNHIKNISEKKND